MHYWQIWIDTGGTFTDGMAIAPHGAVIRIKVLSNSTLRGVVSERTSPGRYRIEQQWHCPEDIFAGYQFHLLGSPNISAFVETVEFSTTDPRTATLQLDRDLAIPGLAGFEITAGEEAPILAARIATRTPLHRPLPPLQMRLGTTKGTNALLEHKGAPVTLFITKGFADLPAIGTQQRPHLFQLDIPAPELLFEQVVEVEERMAPDGTPVQIPKEQYLTDLANRIPAGHSAAIALLHSYRNDAHEQYLAAHLRQKGVRYISCSAALSPAIQLLPRAQTAIVNACLEPVLDAYLSSIRAGVGDARLHIMTSAGGLVRSDSYRPKDSLLSGPAGGVVGAAHIAQELGFDRILTLDMGGTSTDCARYDGRYDYRFLTRVGQAEMLSPALDIETVAAGGGSICRFDGQKLCVGPESAGATPGPACYGAGGPLTITDVNLLMGKMQPRAMGIPIFRDRAEAALKEIQEQICRDTGVHYSEQELLHGFEQIADERMAAAIRRISVARGFDPRDYALLAFGGAGGLHACGVAALLGISTVILPYDAGLLSAYGIGQARVERFAERQVLELLEDCRQTLPLIVGQLLEQAASALKSEGFPTEDIEVLHQLIRLRFLGQSSSIEIDWDGASDLAVQMEIQYRHLFGHYPTGRSIEVESVRLVCGTRAGIGFQGQAHPSDMPAAGVHIHGPAVLPNRHSTAYIPPGWTLEIQPGGNALIRRETAAGLGMEHGAAIELELFTNRFTAIAEEMGAQLQRTAFSVNIKERLDFSCAILDADAELLVNAPHIPVHLGSLGVCARLVRERLPLGPGDVVMTNHPKYGGSHLPDVTLLSAVFSDTGELIGYVVNRAHHAEIGGKTPGSMPPDAQTLEEEGVVIAPMYLVQNGEVQWPAVEKLFKEGPYPTRAPAENFADLNAALASLHSGAEALQTLARTHGTAKVKHYMGALKQLAQRALSDALAALPDGRYEAIEYLDDGSRLRVLVEHEAGRLNIDFSGSSPAHPRNLNANISIVYSVVLYVLRLLVKKDIPLNEGLLQGVRIFLPEGTLLHPRFEDDGRACPAVVGGNTEISQRLTDTLLKALRLSACSQGTMNNFLFGNPSFGYYETIGGGCGAGPGFAGRSAVHQHMTNTRITDPEELELRYPVRLRQFAVRRGSGGAGRWAGGDGIIRELEFTQPVVMTLLTQHRVVPPYGMEGGQDGAPGIQCLISPTDDIEILPGAVQRELPAGWRVRIETPGGGGWGGEET